MSRTAITLANTLLALLALSVAGCASGEGSLSTDVGTGPGDSGDRGAADDVAVELPSGELVPDVPAADALELTGVDLAPADTGFEVVPGSAGYPCASGADCTSGWCIYTADGQQCTMACEEECPFGWKCAQYTPSLPDQIYLCMPEAVDLCRPCTGNPDCWTNGVDLGQACVAYGPAGAFCGSACTSPSDCPAGYSCASVTDITGQVVNQCRLSTGECACTPHYVDLAASTACYVENGFGKCAGTRTCAAGGLTPCDAAVPAAELCNGKDEDCDGTVDEDSAGAECLLTNQWGQCPGTPSCVEGKLECSGDDPAPEICDGLDNNCSGQTDEGFPDTNGDGVKDCLVSDKDGDGVLDVVDNCPAAPNPAQADFDLDGDGDACDADDDNDQVADMNDCKPFDKNVFPGAAEVCNGKDDDCDFMVDEGFPDTDADKLADCAEDDDDNDGVPDLADCAPLDPAAHPGAAETCDGIDNDCDGQVDEALGTVTCGKGACKHTVDACNGGAVTVCDPMEGATIETCDGTDNDCDGLVDEDLGSGMCGVGACVHVASLCKGGKPQACDPLEGASDEQCDGIDNDCDGQVDEELTLLACGKGACFHTVEGCVGGVPKDCDPLAGSKAETCDGVDNDCDGSVDEELGSVSCGKGACKHTQTTCIDGKIKVCDPYEGAAMEKCDGADNDCNGLVDDGFGKTTCGKGICLHTVDNCVDGKAVACDPLLGAEAEACDGDDNDCDGKTDEDLGSLACGKGACFHTLPACVGGVAQQCDPMQGAQKETCDGIDNDCDGSVDEDLGTVECGEGVCFHSQAYCAGGKITVCNPFAGVKPEVCDTLDNDCDGLADEALGSISCGLGACNHTVPACVDGIPQECDPQAGAAEEVCDGKDNDCDGLTDEGLGLLTCGLGECLHTVSKCSEGKIQACDPLEGSSPEFCDGKDNDCDGKADPADSLGCSPYFLDADGDGYGVNGSVQCLCVASPPYSAIVGDDCNDNSTATSPAAAENCQGSGDENCDGKVNEGCIYASCKAALAANPLAASGTYTINPGGVNVTVYCDMTTDGGGWTLVISASIVDNMQGLIGNRDAIIGNTYTTGVQGTLDDAHDLVSPALYALPGKEIMAREGAHTGYWKTDVGCLQDHPLGWWFAKGFPSLSYRTYCTKILGTGTNDMWSTYDLRNNMGGHSNKVVIMFNEKLEPNNWGFIGHRRYSVQHGSIHADVPGGQGDEEGDQGLIVTDNNYAADSSSDAGWNARPAGSNSEETSYGTVPTAIHYFVR